MENKKYQLPREFATKWVEALRSGKYRQGKGRLKNNDSYCCLGVACEISGATERQINHYAYIPKRSTVNVPTLLKSGCGVKGLICTISTMNDSGNTFLEIADWIEQNIEFI